MHNTGIVEGVYKKDVKTKFGNKQTHSFKMDGEFFSCGFTDPRLSVGDEISFEYTEGTYGKEVAKGSIMRGSSGPAPAVARDPTPTSAPKSAAVGSRPFPIPPLHGDRAIIRQNALAHATRLMVPAVEAAVAAKSVDGDGIIEQVIYMARKFEAYACGDLDVARAKEIAAKRKVEEELGE